MTDDDFYTPRDEILGMVVTGELMGDWVPVPGEKVRLKEGVMWGPMFPMKVRQIFKNGWLTLRTDHDNGQRTDAKVRVSDVEPDRCVMSAGYHSTPHRGCIMR